MDFVLKFMVEALDQADAALRAENQGTEDIHVVNCYNAILHAITDYTIETFRYQKELSGLRSEVERLRKEVNKNKDQKQ